VKVLVTGNLGYVGSILFKMLKQENFQVDGLDIGYFPQNIVNNNHTTQKKSDVRNVIEEDLVGYDAICHLAALSNDPLGEINSDLTFEVNHKSTINLAKMAKNAGVKRFIFSSSCSSYGSNQDIVDEKCELLPLTAYAKSKVLAENDLLQLHDQNFIPVNLRSATAYGLSTNLRLDLVANNLTGSAVATGLVKLLSDGSAWRPLVHVDDMANAFITTLKSSEQKIAGQTFNVGGNEDNYTVREIADTVESIVPNSKIVYAKNANKDFRSYKVSFDKIQNELGFKPKRKLYEGIMEMYKKFLELKITEKEFLDKKFYRLKYINWLIEQKIINSELKII